MSLNWREIDAVLEELSLPGSYIQKIRQPDYSSLVLDLYRKSGRLSLYIQLGQNQTRLHRLSKPVISTIKLQRFAQLLRRKIGGGRIIETRQIGGDRIVRIGVTKASADTSLWIRLWSNAANIVLTETDGTIIDSFYRRPKRGEISGGRYLPEDPPDALDMQKKKTYVIREFPGEGDLNERIERIYSNKSEDQTRAKIKRGITKLLNQEESRVTAALENATARADSVEVIQRQKMIGDILMSNLHRMKKGSKWIDAENYYEDNKTITIELNPELSPEGNAKAYYQKAQKRKRRAELSGDEIENLQHTLGELEKKRSIADTEDLDILKNVYAKLVDQQKIKKNDLDGADIPGLRYESGPFTILVGRTARENDALLRNHVRGNDYWLHARDYPGAYVFIRAIRGKSVPLEVLLDAGSLAIHYSKGRSGGHGDLFYTQVKYLRRAKGSKLGLVIPTQEKNLSVRVDETRLSKLLGRRA